MKTTTIVIENPSEEIIQFFTKSRERKEERKAYYKARKDIYFPPKDKK